MTDAQRRAGRASCRGPEPTAIRRNRHGDLPHGLRRRRAGGPGDVRRRRGRARGRLDRALPGRRGDPPGAGCTRAVARARRAVPGRRSRELSRRPRRCGVDPYGFGTDGTDPEEASGVLEPQDTLEDAGVEDVLDTGWSPADRPWAVNDWGTTEREELSGEGLAGRLARGIRARRHPDGDGLGDASDTDGELIDGEVGGRRAGRLSETADEGWGDVEPELYALDVGIDGGSASAEEAAVHIVPDQDGDRGGWT